MVWSGLTVPGSNPRAAHVKIRGAFAFGMQEVKTRWFNGTAALKSINVTQIHPELPVSGASKGNLHIEGDTFSLFHFAPAAVETWVYEPLSVCGLCLNSVTIWPATERANWTYQKGGCPEENRPIMSNSGRHCTSVRANETAQIYAAVAGACRGRRTPILWFSCRSIMIPACSTTTRTMEGCGQWVRRWGLHIYIHMLIYLASADSNSPSQASVWCTAIYLHSERRRHYPEGAFSWLFMTWIPAHIMLFCSSYMCQFGGDENSSC